MINERAGKFIVDKVSNYFFKIIQEDLLLGIWHARYTINFVLFSEIEDSKNPINKQHRLSSIATEPICDKIKCIVKIHAECLEISQYTRLLKSRNEWLEILQLEDKIRESTRKGQTHQDW